MSFQVSTRSVCRCVHCLCETQMSKQLGPAHYHSRILACLCSHRAKTHTPILTYSHTYTLTLTRSHTHTLTYPNAHKKNMRPQRRCICSRMCTTMEARAPFSSSQQLLQDDGQDAFMPGGLDKPVAAGALGHVLWGQQLCPEMSASSTCDAGKHVSLLDQGCFTTNNGSAAPCATSSGGSSFALKWGEHRVSQNRIPYITVYTPYLTIPLVISLPKIPYIHRMYTVYDRIIGDFTARNTVYTPYIYMVLAKAIHTVYIYMEFRQEFHQIHGHTRSVYIWFWPTLCKTNT